MSLDLGMLFEVDQNLQTMETVDARMTLDVKEMILMFVKILFQDWFWLDSQLSINLTRYATRFVQLKEKQTK